MIYAIIAVSFIIAQLSKGSEHVVFIYADDLHQLLYFFYFFYLRHDLRAHISAVVACGYVCLNLLAIVMMNLYRTKTGRDDCYSIQLLETGDRILSELFIVTLQMLLALNPLRPILRYASAVREMRSQWLNYQPCCHNGDIRKLGVI